MARSKFSPSINWLFILTPLSIVLGQNKDISPTVVFFVTALAIVPVAHMIVHATEKIAAHTGEAIGGLLNATFGNAPELIICLVALRSGLIEMVSASIIGVLLANLLLAQGLSFLIGGVRHHDQQYNPNSVRLYNSMMLIAVVSLIVPTAVGPALGVVGSESAISDLSIGVSVMLLLTYVLYLFFTLGTHAKLFAAIEETKPHRGAKKWSVSRSLFTLIGASVLAAILSEVLVGSAEGAGRQLGMSEAFVGLIFVAIVGGAAESLSAISVASRNRMDLSLGISLGSSIQIALFVAPILVLASYFIAPRPFNLIFHKQLLGFLLLSVLLSAIIAGDGRSNWYKGVQLIVLYILLGFTLYLIPAHH